MVAHNSLSKHNGITEPAISSRYKRPPTTLSEVLVTVNLVAWLKKRVYIKSIKKRADVFIIVLIINMFFFNIANVIKLNSSTTN